MIEFESGTQLTSMPTICIKVLGVGGAGSNMVNTMIQSGIINGADYNSIEFIVANTDAQSLRISRAPVNIQLGVKSTKGLGAGANPELGRRAAEEDIEKIIEAVRDADVVFLLGGLGGGTGSGALPVIAKALRDQDILSIGAFTKPFTFEGKRRLKVAQESLDLLEQIIDTLIVIPNQNLIDLVDKKVSLMNAFGMINDILNQLIKAIGDIIIRPGHINVDFADVKTIMKQKGYSVISTGKAAGENRALDAAMLAISSSMLDNAQIAGARYVLLNISGNSTLGLHEVSTAASVIYEQAHEDATIIVGTAFDEKLEKDLMVTVIASGFAKQGASVDYMYALKSNEAEKSPKKDVMLEVLSSTVTSVPVHANDEKTDLDYTNLDIPAVIRRMGQQQRQ